MKACCNQSTVMKCDTPEFIKICAEVGFKEVELRFPKLEEYLADYSYREFRSLLERYGIHVATINALEFFSLVPEENLDFMMKKAEEMMILCRLTECDSLILVPSKNPHNLSLPEIKSKTTQRLQIMSDLAKKYDVKISFEPIGFSPFSVRKIRDAFDIVKKIKNHRITLILDTFHFHIAENTLDDLKKIPGNRISVVHCEDAPDVPLDELNDGHRVFPGEGVIDLQGLCQVLKDNEYEGILSVELFDPKLWDISPKEIVKKARDSLREYI